MYTEKSILERSFQKVSIHCSSGAKGNTTNDKIINDNIQKEVLFRNLIWAQKNRKEIHK